MSTEQMGSRQSRQDRVELGEFVPFLPSKETRSRVGRTVAILEMIDGALQMHDLAEITTVEDLAEAVKTEPAQTGEVVPQEVALPEIKYLPLDKISVGGNAWDDDLYGSDASYSKTYVHPYMRQMDGAIGSNGWHREV